MRHTVNDAAVICHGAEDVDERCSFDQFFHSTASNCPQSTLTHTHGFKRKQEVGTKGNFNISFLPVFGD